jgi:hypothetical protein
LRARGAALADLFLGVTLVLVLAAAAGGAEGAGGFFDARARAGAGGVLARVLVFAALEAGGLVERFARPLAPSLEDASDDLA